MKNALKFIMAASLCGAAHAITWDSVNAVEKTPGSGTYEWNNAANWVDGAAPNGNGALADFNVPLAGNIVVEMPGSYVYLGKLILGDSGGQYKITLTGGAGISFNNNSQYDHSLLIQTASSAGDVIAAPLRFADGDRHLVVSNLSQSAALRLDGQIGANNGNWRNRIYLDFGEMVVGGSNNNGQDPFHMYVRGGTLLCENDSERRPLGDPATLESGILRVANAKCFGWENHVLNVNGGMLDLNGYETGFFNLRGTGGIITSLPAGNDPLSLLFNRNAGTSFGGQIVETGVPLHVRVTEGSVEFFGNNSYGAGTYIRSGTMIAGSDLAFGSGSIVMHEHARLRNSGAEIRTIANDILFDGADNAPRFFGFPGTGELALGHLHFKSANGSYGIEADSTVSFTNIFYSTNMGKSGAGAAIVRGDIVADNLNNRWVRVTGGMLALTGSFLYNHGLELRGQTATFGWAGARNIILDYESSGSVEKLRWMDDGGFSERGGGFSGFGGDLTVSLSTRSNPNNYGMALDWGVTPFFVFAGTPIVFGHAEADGMATLVNDITLNAVATNYVNVLRGKAPIDGRFAGNLTGASGAVLSKQHNGVLSLAGAANAWPGMAEVMGGVLRVDGGLVNNAVYVGEDGALGGAGTLTAANIVIDGALLAEAGKGVGLTVNGGVALNGALRVCLDDEGTKAPVVNGALLIAAGARLEIVEPENGLIPDSRRRKVLIGSQITGRFDGLPEDGVIELSDGTVWTVSYSAGSITVGPRAKDMLMFIR